MIYDCFTFFNELDLLEIRLNVLDQIVDKFVLVECDKTHSGQPKPFYYRENRERFKRFAHRIVTHKWYDLHVSHPPNPWVHENLQRNAISYVLDWMCFPLQNDVIMISDLDEIPRPDAIRQWLKGDRKGVGYFAQGSYKYWLNMVSGWDWLNGTRILTYGSFKSGTGYELPEYTQYLVEECNQGITPTKIRFVRDRIIHNGGWHFSWLGGVESVRTKLNAFAHQEMNTVLHNDTTFIEDVIAKRRLLHDSHAENCHVVKLKYPEFPEYIVNNQEKYAHLIKS
jgi:beta-1,4-mannosyl-glycoprotein beta-1,4-N-acetylglucosaminyltransferase